MKPGAYTVAQRLICNLALPASMRSLLALELPRRALDETKGVERMKSVSCVLRVFLVLAILAGFVDRAFGGPISGTAVLAGAVTAGFDFSGPNLTANSATPDWPSTVLICAVNSICDVTLTVPAFPVRGNFGGSSGTFNGVTADSLSGELTFGGTMFVPAGVSDFTALVTLQGNIEGHNGPNGPLLWSLAISGTGTLSTSVNAVSGLQDIFFHVGYTFEGTATPVPEPPSMLLLATAMAALARIVGGQRVH